MLTYTMPNAHNLSGVYVIHNSASGSFYIGSTVDMPTRRAEHWRAMRAGKHSNPRMQRAWDRDGADAFEFVPLAEVAPEELELCEGLLLAAFCGRADCYNIATDPANPNRGRSLTREHAERIGAANRGRQHGEAFRARMRAAGLGKRQDDESKQKRRATWRDMPAAQREAHRANVAAGMRRRLAMLTDEERAARMAPARVAHRAMNGSALRSRWASYTPEERAARLAALREARWGKAGAA